MNITANDNNYDVMSVSHVKLNLTKTEPPPPKHYGALFLGTPRESTNELPKDINRAESISLCTYSTPVVSHGNYIQYYIIR